MAYQLYGLYTEYLEFSKVSAFVSAVFMKTINCMGESFDCHLNINYVIIITIQYSVNKNHNTSCSCNTLPCARM